MRKRTMAAVLATAFVAGEAGAKDDKGVAITIYNPSAAPAQQVPQYGGYQYRQPYVYNQPQYGQTGYVDPNAYAVVTERRKVTVGAGSSEIRFANVPTLLDPSTVHVVDETDPAAVIAQQRFENDLATVDSLLQKTIGQPITIVTDAGERTGTLLFFDASQFLIKTDDAKTPMQIVQRGKHIKDVRFAAPTGSVTGTPSLVWQVVSKKAGEHVTQVTYQTRGISWSADYNVVLSTDQKKVDVTGWLSVVNQSGAKFDGAAIRLVAGDVARDTGTVAANAYPYDQYGNPIPAGPQKPPPRFEYEIPGTATIEHNATKQVEMFGTVTPTLARTVVYEHVPAQINYLKQNYGATWPLLQQNADGYQTKNSAQLDDYLEIGAPKGAKLNLPPGKVRVYKKGDAGSLELVSESRVEAGDKDDGLRVKMGTTTDITAERRQAEFHADENARTMTEKFEIKLKNGRKEAVEVVVVEHMYRWNHWSLSDESSPGTMNTAGDAATFRVKLPANGSQTLTFKVIYTW